MKPAIPLILLLAILTGCQSDPDVLDREPATQAVLVRVTRASTDEPIPIAAVRLAPIVDRPANMTAEQYMNHARLAYETYTEITNPAGLALIELTAAEIEGGLPGPTNPSPHRVLGQPVMAEIVAAHQSDIFPITLTPNASATGDLFTLTILRISAPMNFPDE